MACCVLASPNASCQPCRLNWIASPGRLTLTLFTTMKPSGATVTRASAASTRPPIHTQGAARTRSADWRTDRVRSVTAIALASAPEEINQHAPGLRPPVDVVIVVVGVEVG